MKRGFIVVSKAWYADVILKGRDYRDEIMFGMYGEHGSITDGEMAVRWHKNFPVVPRLEVYDDSWAVLASFMDVIVAMGKYDNKDVTVDQFAELLVGCGFEDMTPINGPNWGKMK